MSCFGALWRSSWNYKCKNQQPTSIPLPLPSRPEPTNRPVGNKTKMSAAATTTAAYAFATVVAVHAATAVAAVSHIHTHTTLAELIESTFPIIDTAIIKEMRDAVSYAAIKGTLESTYEPVYNEHCAAIAKAIDSTNVRHINKISLWNQHIGDVGCTLIARALTVFPDSSSLHWVDLSYNNIGDEGIVALAKAFSDVSFKWSTTLDVGNNKFGDVGAIALANALKEYDSLKHLTTLTVAGNGIGPKGRTALEEARKVHIDKRYTYLPELKIQFG